LSENTENYRDNLAAQRKGILETLGGLAEATVQNAEWLYMLQEETRNSVSIEGYVATEQELRAMRLIEGFARASLILSQKRCTSNWNRAITDRWKNCFSTGCVWAWTR
jgi:hypothetical protein